MSGSITEKYSITKASVVRPWSRSWVISLSLDQWFFTKGAFLPREPSINFQGCASPYTPKCLT